MENASKALIIAGAILISIVIISLGVVIIGQGQDVVNQSDMNDQVVSTWNQKWTQYEGERVSGSNVNTLINQVLASNTASAQSGSTDKYITLEGGDDTTKNIFKFQASSTNAPSYTKSANKAKSGNYFEVKTTPGANGYIQKITITKK